MDPSELQRKSRPVSATSTVSVGGDEGSMNVVYYLKHFPKLSETFILNEIYALEQAGHNVAVFVLGNPQPDNTHPEFSELDAPILYAGALGYDDLSLLFDELLHPTVIQNTISTNMSLHDIAYLIRTKQCIEFIESLPWEVDVVHTHFATREKFACPNIAAYFDVPFTITTHAFDIYRDMDEETEALLRAADRIVTISEYNRSYLRGRSLENTPIDVVHAGIRPEKFSPAGDCLDNRILTVSRFKEKKGLRYALEAVAIVARDRPDIEYHLVGSGRQLDTLARLTRKLGIEQNVNFLQNISDSELITEYDQARCFLLPSVITASGERDGIPVVLMESMAMETPPISTFVSGIPELIDHETNGILVNPRDPDGIADAIHRLLRKDAEWAAYRRQGRKKVDEDFNVSKEISRLEKAFDAAQSDHRES